MYISIVIEIILKDFFKTLAATGEDDNIVWLKQAWNVGLKMIGIRRKIWDNLKQ